jgi:hypothetical protein
VELSNGVLDDFIHIFTGNTSAHGEFIPGSPANPGEKQEGQAFSKVETVEYSLYEKHLSGEKGLGIVPVRQDGTCSFAVLDVDIYDSDHSAIVRAVHKHHIPLLPFRSKSGGLHLYLFLETVYEARKIVAIMNAYRKLFQLKKSTEIFPKQSIVDDGKVGSWINIPYFNVGNEKQYLYDYDGNPTPLEEAIDIIKAARVSAERIPKLLGELPLFDAPPCLQSIYTIASTHDRNQYLFDMAVYYKAREGDDYEFTLLEANNELDNPVKPSELSDTVIKSFKKKHYSYKCNEEPICSICDKTECKTRKYGIGGTEVSDISYEDFIQYGEDEPTYEWIINGKTLHFVNETDIIKQDRFRELCFRELHILPFRLTEFSWTEIINTALHNIIVKNADEIAGLSLTPSQLFKEHLVEFLTRRAQAANQEQVLVDRVYKDEDIQAWIFKPKNLLVFLTQQKQFRAYGIQQVGEKLRKMGAYPKLYYIRSKKCSTRVWVLPYEGAKKYIDEDYQDVAIDFLDDVKKEEY